MEKIDLGAGYFKIISSAEEKEKEKLLAEQILEMVKGTILCSSIATEIVDTYEYSKEASANDLAKPSSKWSVLKRYARHVRKGRFEKY